MLLKPGSWLGRGSLLVEGQSIGRTLNVSLKLSDEAEGLLFEGDLDIQNEATSEYSIRIVPNDVGTYIVDAFVRGARLDGTAKLESDPNLGLLWNAANTIHASFTVFPVSAGVGFRGFVRERETTFTWELALKPQQSVVQGGNVVSLTRRRR